MIVGFTASKTCGVYVYYIVYKEENNKWKYGFIQIGYKHGVKFMMRMVIINNKVDKI